MSNFDFGKNIIIFGIDNSSLIHVVNRKNIILNLRKGSTQGLEDPTITPEVNYFANITESEETLCLSLRYNKSNRFLYGKSVKICQLKANDSKIKPYSLYLGNISKYFTVDNMKKQN